MNPAPPPNESRHTHSCEQCSLGRRPAMGQGSSQMDPHTPHLSPSWCPRPQDSGENNRKDGFDIWDSETTSHLSSEAHTDQRQARRGTGVSVAGAGFQPDAHVVRIKQRFFLFPSRNLCSPICLKICGPLGHLSFIFLCLMETWISNSLHSSSLCRRKPVL